MLAFIRRHVDASTRLGEVLFGLIMALGITGAVRFGFSEADNRALFIAVLGCNLAWGIVDGVMYALLALFERGRKARIVNAVRNAPNDESSLKVIQQALIDQLPLLTSQDERLQIYRWILDSARKSNPEPPRIQPKDILGGLSVGVLVFVATIPVLIPFAVFSNPTFAVRASNWIGLAMLFGVGWWWARVVGTDPWRIGIGMTAIGLFLVLLSIALGG